MLKKLKEFKWGYILLFITILAVGLTFIIFDEGATKNLAIAIGIIIIVFGTVFAVSALAEKERGFKFGFRIILGICIVVSGAITIIANQAIGFIISLFALFLIMDSAFKLGTASYSKRYGVSAWWLILIFAILVASGGYVTLYTVKESVANETLDITTKLVGCTMLADAVANMLSAFFISSYEKRMEKEIEKRVTDTLENKKEKTENQ